MFKQLLATALLYVLFTGSVSAERYVVDVEGIVCELCAYGVAKKVRKLDFIDATQLERGVKVDIENQTVFVAVRKDASLDKTLLFNAIEAGGYNPIKIWAIDASGKRSELAP